MCKRTALVNSFSSRRVCLYLSLIFTHFLFSVSGAAQSEVNQKGNIVTIPLSIVAVDEATATISVMEEPLSSLNIFLKHCQISLPDNLQEEGKDFSNDMKGICQLAEKLAKQYMPPPTHHLEPKGYVITVPLKSPFQKIESLYWTTKSLDDAISFVSLLQGGSLKAIKVYTAIPWGSDPTMTCTECPIKELVFPAKALKDQLGELKRKEGQ